MPRAWGYAANATRCGGAVLVLAARCGAAKMLGHYSNLATPRVRGRDTGDACGGSAAIPCSCARGHYFGVARSSGAASSVLRSNALM